jgi:CspA family cold shock protein
VPGSGFARETDIEKELKMAQGTVKWFNDSKGFGFITPDGGGPDLFAHHTEIQMSGFKTLKEQQRVEFEPQTGPKGPLAAKISALA